MTSDEKTFPYKSMMFQLYLYHLCLLLSLSLIQNHYQLPHINFLQILIQSVTPIWLLLQSLLQPSLQILFTQCKPDQNLVSLNLKYTLGSLDKYKAHLVAKGFQQTAGIDFLENFSPVIKASIIQIIFTLAVTKGCDI